MKTIEQQIKDGLYKQLKDELKLENINQVPKIEKVTLNVGFGKSSKDKRVKETAELTLRKISGQQPVITHARKAIAAFKLREGQEVGLKVTLRGKYMMEFLDRLINIVIPRFRDFHGLSKKSFDKEGNYSIGISDQSVFPELTFDDMPITHGLQVNIITSTRDKTHAKALLKAIGVPLEKENN